ERTKELGVFKAVGARNRDIMGIVVLESGMLSLLGGIIGAALGSGVALVAGKVVAAAGYAAFRPLVTWQLILGVLLFSLLIGIIAGIFPAYQASKLRPVDALRYE
ncbi:MAG: FtsX-like permease family protein, partial [Nanoarchaeota archaeon]